MPIPDLTNSGFTAKEDSQFFEITYIEPAIKKEFEGGFVVTRPRFTRMAPRQITTGFTDIDNTNYQKLQDFYVAMRGGSIPFVYNHPISGEAITVRFESPIKGKYVGMGSTRRWNIPSITLTEV